VTGSSLILPRPPPIHRPSFLTPRPGCAGSGGETEEVSSTTREIYRPPLQSFPPPLSSPENFKRLHPPFPLKVLSETNNPFFASYGVEKLLCSFPFWPSQVISVGFFFPPFPPPGHLFPLFPSESAQWTFLLSLPPRNFCLFSSRVALTFLPFPRAQATHSFSREDSFYRSP